MTKTVRSFPKSKLEDAIALAVKAHKGQKDKAGQPYILHPLSVMRRVHGEDAQTVAVLHDVVEDTPYTMADLRMKGFSKEILAALACVTKRDGESYEAFVLRAKRIPIARRVKLADIEDNLDVRRMRTVREKDRKRLNRYLAARRVLLED